MENKTCKNCGIQLTKDTWVRFCKNGRVYKRRICKWCLMDISGKYDFDDENYHTRKYIREIPESDKEYLRGFRMYFGIGFDDKTANIADLKVRERAMIYTNKLNLPESVFNAIKEQGESHKGQRFTASGLANNSIRMHQLKQRHSEGIIVDVADRYKAWMGSAIHKALESHVAANELSEQYLEMDIHLGKLGKETISGTADLVTQEGNEYRIVDYKTTSVNKYIFADYEEWTRQLNIYACLFWEQNFSIKSLGVMMMFNDWYPTKVLSNPDYPRSPVKLIELKIYPKVQTMEYINKRILETRHYDKTPDDELPMCNDKELWATGEAWAVMKKGRKSAVKLFKKELDHNEEQAKEYAEERPGHYVEHRPPKVKRCLYCDAKQFCNQYRSLVGKGLVEGIAPSGLANSKAD
jgi:hypothetical protein